MLQTICAGFLAVVWTAGAQQPAYLDTSLPAQRRAADLVGRMTLEEKLSQLSNAARAIPRLNIPAYNWWSEALHGVSAKGVTEFPEPIGLAATFDAPGIHQMAVAIGTEGRIKHEQALVKGASGFLQGLDFWAPNLNIFRDPRWGRGQETYGEDPFLSGRMGVAFVTGMQGDDPRYYRTISTPKHYAVHNGPEPTRHKADVTVSKHDELDTYLPAFRAAVVEGKAGSVMCAYNSINGQPACANEFLLEDQLRGKWGFQGYVVSDCAAVRDIFDGHRYTKSQAEASAISLKRGMDNECLEGVAGSDDHDYAPYREAVQKGFLKESDIDVALRRLFTARIRMGMFDPPELVPYTKIDPKLLDSPRHRALARKLADESMVLLKNDGVLPLKNAPRKIAVVGPLADQRKPLLGNYSGQPTRTVSVLEGLRNEYPDARIRYEPGTEFLNSVGKPVPGALLRFGGKAGVRARYYSVERMEEPDGWDKVKPLATRVERSIQLEAGSLPRQVAGNENLNVRWDTTITATESGDYDLGMTADGFFFVTLNGKPVTMTWGTDGVKTKMNRVHLERGQPAELSVRYRPTEGKAPDARLVWSKRDLRPKPEAVAAAKEADVVVAVVGITSDLESEEMPINEEGFNGGDRTSIDLPRPEQDLLEAVAAAGKPLIVVLINGSALAVNWAQKHANAILEAWYPGEEGGAAVAETLSGRNNPGGRLPVTFYKSVDQLPPFEDYAMKGRTYRYFTGTPLYPFGYGLSYTTFAYSDLKLPAAPIAAGGPLKAEATVTNTGKLAGDEVVELYLSFPDVAGAPLKALRAFRRVHLDAGASEKVQFELQPRDLSMVTEAGDIVVPEGEFQLSIGGGQPGTGAPHVAGTFRVSGSVKLPE
jgi:beta-glucosidase